MHVLRWIRLMLSCVLFLFLMVSAYHHQASIYLLYQAKGQFTVLFNRQDMARYKASHPLSEAELSNLELVEKIKRYSVDSLEYAPTANFNTVFDQQHSPLLWVITACEPFSLKAYTWYFPIVGEVSYKGFFNKQMARREYNHLVCQDYDVDMRPVSAWSTLGWFSDPLLSGMLQRSRGGLCNLLFHELFHATYYAPSSVDLNENLASFVAHKATLQFLANDTLEKSRYLKRYMENQAYDKFMLRQAAFLAKYYLQIENLPNKKELKLKALMNIADSLAFFEPGDRNKYLARRAEILSSKNACFVDFRQYDALQDSLEGVFNKIYGGQIKKLVHHLKSD